MKKTLIIVFALLASLCNAQEDIYQKVNAFLKQNNPDLIIQNKVLVVNFANPQQKDAGGVYKSLEKTGSVYQVAKLKGGRNGVICVTVVKDSQEEIALNKLGYKHIYVINGSQLENTDTKGIDNITFDSMGKVVYKNLESNKIFEAINHLITR